MDKRIDEIEGVLWDSEDGWPYAILGNYEGNRILVKEWIANDPTGQEFSREWNTSASIERIKQVLELHKMNVSSRNLAWAFTRLKDSGQLVQPAAASVIVPDVPRGKDGRPLTKSQLEWRQSAIWANDPKTSSRAIADKRRSSPSFNKFYIESLRREFEQVHDGRIPEGTVQDDDAPSVSDAEYNRLANFATAFNAMPVAEARKKSLAAFNPRHEQFTHDSEICRSLRLL